MENKNICSFSEYVEELSLLGFTNAEIIVGTYAFLRLIKLIIDDKDDKGC